MKTRHTENNSEIMLTVPTAVADDICNIILNVLEFAGHNVRRINEEGEELFTIKEAFPDGHPGMVLHGARLREEMTQAELAEKLNITQNRVSEMESGKRNISKNMALKLAKFFDTSYRVFL
jgi:addiction module HigA family antidote